MSVPLAGSGRSLMTAAARTVAGQLSGRGCYCIAYGSHAADTNGPHSDLDLLQVVPAMPGPDQVRHLEEIVIRLHHDHGLELDTEVAYEVKLIATHPDVRAALDHVPFLGSSTSERSLATAVPTDATYLNSDTFKQRLILNALTSPNIFLGGDLATFTEHSVFAESSLALLAMRIMASRQQEDLTAFTLDDAVYAVTVGPDEAQGQDFLGYRRSASLLATLNQGLHRLITSRIVTVDQSAIWRPGSAWTGSATSTAVLRYWS